jgi:hypothetical protein
MKMNSDPYGYWRLATHSYIRRGALGRLSIYDDISRNNFSDVRELCAFDNYCICLEVQYAANMYLMPITVVTRSKA